MDPDRISTVKNPYGVFSFLSNDEFIGGYLKAGLLWDEHVVQYMRPLLSHDDVVLDVGAHVGCFAIAMAAQCRVVHAFEAQRVLHQLLVRNLSESRVVNVFANNVAIGDRAGYARLRRELLDGTNRVLAYDTTEPTNYGGVAVEASAAPTDLPMTTIDSLGLAPFMIKIDVEGFEDFVIAGALATIEACRPVIVYERNFKYRASNQVADLEVLLAAKYDRPWHLGEGPDYVLYPLHPLGIPRELSDGSGSKITVANRSVCIRNAGSVRGPFRLFTPRIGRLRVHLGDVGKILDGAVAWRSIRWNDGTTWTSSG